jgi:hypothetical protein
MYSLFLFNIDLDIARSSEYLAMFKKTVSMHEVFLQRLAAHPILRTDHNFRVFLEYKEDVRCYSLIYIEFIVTSCSIIILVECSRQECQRTDNRLF